MYFQYFFELPHINLPLQLNKILTYDMPYSQFTIVTILEKGQLKPHPATKMSESRNLKPFSVTKAHFISKLGFKNKFMQKYSITYEYMLSITHATYFIIYCMEEYLAYFWDYAWLFWNMLHHFMFYDNLGGTIFMLDSLKQILLEGDFISFALDICCHIIPKLGNVTGSICL